MENCNYSPCFAVHRFVWTQFCCSWSWFFVLWFWIVNPPQETMLTMSTLMMPAPTITTMTNPGPIPIAQHTKLEPKFVFTTNHNMTMIQQKPGKSVVIYLHNIIEPTFLIIWIWGCLQNSERVVKREQAFKNRNKTKSKKHKQQYHQKPHYSKLSICYV